MQFSSSFRPTHGHTASSLHALIGAVLFVAAAAIPGRAEDGYRLWLRYERVDDADLRQAYQASVQSVVPLGRSATLDAVCDELREGLHGLLGHDVPTATDASADGAVLVGTISQPGIAALQVAWPDLGDEGYAVRAVTDTRGRRHIVIAGAHDIGVLYGTFAFLRQLQLHAAIDRLSVVSVPRVQRRLLNHWDDLNGYIERGYAGQSLWNWFVLPDWVDPRIRDYARANASIGVNGAVLNNVNAKSLILTTDYLEKVAAIAKVLRPYGIRVYLSVRFTAPMEIGGLKTADPLDPAVAAWWKAKADEIYALIPDFGGWLVKANSEGQPGPADYGRTHDDGANAFADVLAPHGGIVMWRAFVYESKTPEDRTKKAYLEFKPRDGKFRPNVVVQVKNGPLDFMPREPFHPLFGAMPHTSLGLELQITQEYLGFSAQLAFLAPLWKEILDADTHAQGPGSTVARVIDGSLDHQSVTLMAGVSNIGDARNWTGHPLAQANWYAFGRLAWEPALTAETIADEWTRLTFGSDPDVRRILEPMLLESREVVVNYSMPLGLAHLMAPIHHYGPAPWDANKSRPEWGASYYHQADAKGIGFDRTETGSNAVAQYAPPVEKQFADLATCPDALLLWFHHLPWDYSMRSGRTLWDELCLHYQAGVDAVRGWQKQWETLEPKIDPTRFRHVKALLVRQERDARQWRDACTQYFQTFSQRPLPPGVEPPDHPLSYYRSIRLRYVPGFLDAK